MSWVAVAVGGMQAWNQYTAGQTAQGMAGVQALAMEGNAKIERANALQTAEMIRRAGRRQIGAANAAYAGAGVKVGEGSALEMERQTGIDVEHDAFQAILDGDRRAAGLTTDAGLTRISGSMAAKAGEVNAAGTLLSTGGNAYNKWNTMQQPSYSDTTHSRTGADIRARR